MEAGSQYSLASKLPCQYNVRSIKSNNNKRNRRFKILQKSPFSCCVEVCVTYLTLLSDIESIASVFSFKKSLLPRRTIFQFFFSTIFLEISSNDVHA